jgi:hypothetical protein
VVNPLHDLHLAVTSAESTDLCSTEPQRVCRFMFHYRPKPDDRAEKGRLRSKNSYS